MAKVNTVSDPYLESIMAQIKENDEAIKAAVPPRLIEKKAELETALKHYKAYKKSQGS